MIIQLNEKLKGYCNDNKLVFIDLYHPLLGVNAKKCTQTIVVMDYIFRIKVMRFGQILSALILMNDVSVHVRGLLLFLMIKPI